MIFSYVSFLCGLHFRETQTALDPGLPICQVSQPNELNCVEPIPPVHINDVSKSGEIGNVAVELHAAQANAPEDPASVIDSILNENNSGNQSDPLLDRYADHYIHLFLDTYAVVLWNLIIKQFCVIVLEDVSSRT